MKKLILGLVLVLCGIISLTIGCDKAQAGSMQSFLSQVRSAPGVISATQEVGTVWVQVQGTQDFQARGQELADMMAAWHKAEVGGPICIRIFYGNRNTIGRACNY